MRARNSSVAQAALEDRHDAAQQFVAREVAEGVVDAVQEVDVHVHEGVRGAGAARGGERRFQPLLEGLAVGEPREGVVGGEEEDLLAGVVEPLLQALLLRLEVGRERQHLALEPLERRVELGEVRAAGTAGGVPHRLADHLHLVVEGARRAPREHEHRGHGRGQRDHPRPGLGRLAHPECGAQQREDAAEHRDGDRPQRDQPRRQPVQLVLVGSGRHRPPTPPASTGSGPCFPCRCARTSPRGPRARPAPRAGPASLSGRSGAPPAAVHRTAAT